MQPPSVGIRFPNMPGAACKPKHWHTLFQTFLGHVSQNKVGKIMPMCGPTFPLLIWAMWPRTVGANYANTWACMQTHALAYLCMPMRVAACNRTHWHTCFPYLSGPCGLDKLGDNMAILGVACSPKHWHTFFLTCLCHVAQKSRGTVCQCMGLHAAPGIGILVPYVCGPHGPDK